MVVVVVVLSISDIWKPFLERNLSSDDYSGLPSCTKSQPLAWEQSHSLPHLPPSFLSSQLPRNMISDLP